MGKLQKDQKGFSAVEGLLILILIAIIGFVGYYVWHTQDADKKAKTEANVTTPVETTPGDNEAAVMHKPAEALTLVDNAYKKYFAYAQEPAQENGSQTGLDKIKDSLSPALYAKLNEEIKTAPRDVILCAQMPPNSLSTALGTTTTDMATVLVNEVYDSSKEQVTTKVDLATLKITDITCNL